MTNERRVIIHPDKQTLAGAVAARFITTVVDLLDQQDETTVLLTGGTMGAAVLTAIRDSPARDAIDWERVNFWWSDERWLPVGDPERNEMQSRAALLDHVPINQSRVHPFASSGTGVSQDDAAIDYAAELERHAEDGQRMTRFDIAFLGVGPDGHIASLFPEQSGIAETELPVIAVQNAPKPPADRLSLTLPVINSSEWIWLVVAGADKASALGLTLADASVHEVPAAGVEGRKGTVFFVDREAAAELPEALASPGLFWTADSDRN